MQVQSRRARVPDQRQCMDAQRDGCVRRSRQGCEKSRWKSAARYGMMARMEPSTFGLQAAGAGGGLPAEWQALLASQASTLAALVSWVQTAAVTLRQRQALAAEAERVLTAQALGQGNVAQEGCNEPDPRRRWRRPAVGGEGWLGLGDQPPSRDLSREGRHCMGLGTGDALRAWA